MSTTDDESNCYATPVEEGYIRYCSQKHEPLFRTPGTLSSQFHGSDDIHYLQRNGAAFIFPPTPSPTPIRGTKRQHARNLTNGHTKVSSSSESECELERPSKRVLFTPKPIVSKAPRSLFFNIPTFSILHKPVPVSISSQELRRVSESVLGQIDWEEVAGYVASNRKGSRYRRLMEEILLDKLTEFEDMEGGGHEVQ
ncbi:MAG: hypothetical protein M1827_007236 [Pycnora praestabilis]|nr:MAG: hypothetical protein M1827_007236 [Pycnora praestabilis]